MVANTYRVWSEQTPEGFSNRRRSESWEGTGKGEQASETGGKHILQCLSKRGDPPRSELQAEAVVSEKNVFGQLFLGGGVAKIVAQMREVSRRGTQSFGQGNAFAQIHVRWVSSAAGRAQDQRLNTFENSEAIRVDRLAV